MEEPGKYQTELEEALNMPGTGYGNPNPAAVIERPRRDMELRDDGLYEYKVWGWVKISAKFIAHIRKLKGAKLAIWQVIALSIDEDGKCELPVEDIALMSGYSESETRETLRELEEMGYLSVNRRQGRKSIYQPEFAARSSADPTQDIHPSRKTTPPVSTQGYPSSPPIEQATPIPLELKELKHGDKSPDTENLPIDWQVGLGGAITTNDEESMFHKQARDSANSIEMGCAGGGELAYAFMVTRKIIIPESKAKGQRKAAREMLEMHVKANHIVEATKKLMEARDKRGNPLTVVDLFSVQDTAIGIANQPKSERTTQPVQVDEKGYIKSW